jgi:hypothetical protein
MLAKIGFYVYVREPMEYNEEKVAQGAAHGIGAENFLKDLDQL